MPERSGYADHDHLLRDVLEHAEARLQAAILRRRRRDARLGDPNPLGLIEELTDFAGEDPEALENQAEQAARTIASRIAATDRRAVPLPLADLWERFDLSGPEREILTLALAPSLRLDFGAYFSALRPTGLRGTLDVDLALTLVAGTETTQRLAARRLFAPTAPLCRNHLIQLDRHRIEHGDSFLSLGIRLPGRVLALLLGDDDRAAALSGYTHLLQPTIRLDDVVLDPETKASIRALVERQDEYRATLEAWGLDERITYGRGVALLFVGAPGTGKTMTARAIAAETGRKLLLVDPNQVFDVKRPVEDNLAELFREARLQNAIVFFDECEGLFAHRAHGGAFVGPILTAIERYEGIVILSTNDPRGLDPALDRRVLFRVVFETPTAPLRRRIWEQHLGDRVPLADDVDLDRLARQFDFSGGYVKNSVLVAVHRALARPQRPAQITGADLEAAARTQLRARLSEYAERHVTPLRMADLVLPEETAAQIDDFLDAARSRSIVFREWGFGEKLSKGKGLSALFDGEPGTGKTLCAEILAGELGLSLYRIQVANVVSKYIGETEKNLMRVFREADQAHCLLLFDEADALFSQRTDVKSVQDKYANMEINVLLQLMERYEGIVVLTTNLKKGIDKAFERRLSFKVHFPFPEPDLRAQIWERLIPDAAPLDDDVRFEAMAKGFELSGGSIKNAIVRAAYRAAAQRRPIGMNDLVDAARYECAASGKLYRLPSMDDDF